MDHVPGNVFAERISSYLILVAEFRSLKLFLSYELIYCLRAHSQIICCFSDSKYILLLKAMNGTHETCQVLVGIPQINCLKEIQTLIGLLFCHLQ